jgi:hypothetical protein
MNAPHPINRELPPTTLGVNPLGDFALHRRYVYRVALSGRAQLWGISPYTSVISIVPRFPVGLNCGGLQTLEGRFRTTYLHMVSYPPERLVMNDGGLTVPLEGRCRSTEAVFMLCNARLWSSTTPASFHPSGLPMPALPSPPNGSSVSHKR